MIKNKIYIVFIFFMVVSLSAGYNVYSQSTGSSIENLTLTEKIDALLEKYDTLLKAKKELEKKFFQVQDQQKTLKAEVSYKEKITKGIE